ncbi:hypothetical protein NQZ68_030749 [Dissostichus eleginoides]|nr:hypothetical protein NQZ68_030749 [Dissostichus eleginoides]
MKPSPKGTVCLISVKFDHQPASWWLSEFPTCVSTASGLTLSDQLSTADSTRSSDDDPGPGLPCGRSTVHIHSGSAM